MAKKNIIQPQKTCQPLVIISCQENFKRLTKLEYLVLLIIKNFGGIKLQDKETKEYYWPDMSECVSHYLGTQRFDEVLEVVMAELFHKDLLETDALYTDSYINLKLNEVQITSAFDGSIIYDRFALKHKYYKLVGDMEDIRFRAVAKNNLPNIEPCKKIKGKQCLTPGLSDIRVAFMKYIGEKYPGHEGDILVDIHVYPNMVDLDEEQLKNILALHSEAEAKEQTEPANLYPFCLE